jgi:pseudaminic acid biosynthesis-associated methylase
MQKISKQITKWKNEFGKEYTDRNALTLDELERMYENNFGLSRTKLNNIFIGKLNHSIKILEVGSNIGNQLLLLQKMGFKNLYGIEINDYAVELSKQRTNNINIIQGSAFDIPFKNEYFDLVFTSGVLIHISPHDINLVLNEIYKCTKKYIWGFEYYNEKYTEIIYRGKKDLLWKANFPQLYLSLFKDVKLIKEKKLKYLNDNNIDVMFLLDKEGNK